MNGKFLLDTNAVIALLKGNIAVHSILQNAVWVGITIITELEFLSFSNLTQEDKNLFVRFKNKIDVVNLESANATLIDAICYIRQTKQVKLPDAIIAASAIHENATLISNDLIFLKIPNLNTLNF